MATKIKETMMSEPQGMSETVSCLVRVRKLKTSETLPDPLPPTIVVLADDDQTPLSDWHIEQGEGN